MLRKSYFNSSEKRLLPANSNSNLMNNSSSNLLSSNPQVEIKSIEKVSGDGGSSSSIML